MVVLHDMPCGSKSCFPKTRPHCICQPMLSKREQTFPGGIQIIENSEQVHSMEGVQ
jgi:hypothetical protein